jgi:hypothetical protein
MPDQTRESMYGYRSSEARERADEGFLANDVAGIQECVDSTC